MERKNRLDSWEEFERRKSEELIKLGGGFMFICDVGKNGRRNILSLDEIFPSLPSGISAS